MPTCTKRIEECKRQVLTNEFKYTKDKTGEIFIKNSSRKDKVKLK